MTSQHASPPLSGVEHHKHVLVEIARAEIARHAFAVPRACIVGENSVIHIAVQPPPRPAPEAPVADLRAWLQARHESLSTIWDEVAEAGRGLYGQRYVYVVVGITTGRAIDLQTGRMVEAVVLAVCEERFDSDGTHAAQPLITCELRTDEQQRTFLGEPTSAAPLPSTPTN